MLLGPCTQHPILGPKFIFRITDGGEKRLARWYFGGLASAGAACCTHPLDLLKVHLQTQHVENIGVARQTMNIIRSVNMVGQSGCLSAPKRKN